MTSVNLFSRLTNLFLIACCMPSTLFGATEWPGLPSPTLIERWEAELIVLVDVVEIEKAYSGGRGGQSSRL